MWGRLSLSGGGSGRKEGEMPCRRAQHWRQWKGAIQRKVTGVSMTSNSYLLLKSDIPHAAILSACMPGALVGKVHSLFVLKLKRGEEESSENLLCCTCLEAWGWGLSLLVCMSSHLPLMEVKQA